jgi:hypothetical protein
LLELGADLGYGTDQRVRMLCQHFRCDAEPPRHGIQRAGWILADRHEVGADLEFDAVEAVAGALADPADLLYGRVPGRAPDAARPELAARVVEVDAHDVRQPACELQHPGSAAPDEDRGMRLLHRQWPPGEAGRMHVRALDIDRLSAPVRLENLDDLG